MTKTASYLRLLGGLCSALNRAAPAAAALLTTTLLGACGHESGAGTEGGEWRSYGGDPGSRRYSPLDQIHRHNVGELKIAWTWESVDVPLGEEDRKLRWPGFQATPIMVGGVLFTSTSLSQVAAMDAASGETLWVFDPESYKSGRPPNWGFVHRGVTYWSAGDQARIFVATGSAELYALNPETGQPVPGFGQDGKVDLRRNVPRLDSPRQFGVTSPPVTHGNVVIVGSSISDGPVRKEMVPGSVRGFDALSGELVWTFATIPRRGDVGYDTWEGGSADYSGNTNVWAPMSVDPDLGYVYFGVSTPTNDWYGGHRPGDNVFAESLVCLNAKTGERVWHYQMVHHGLWDYDPPAAPVLCDINVDGRKIRAVVQVTKQGFCYVFDRVSGEPVWPIEERPVPQSTVDGEATSSTQPFPTKPPPFERQGITADDLIDFTPELRTEAMEIKSRYVSGPLFTPPTVRGQQPGEPLGTLQLPGSSGGANWGGAAFDPRAGVLYVPSITSPIVVALTRPDPSRSNFRYVRQGLERPPGPQGLPLVKPPYGRITAIDLNRGELLWQVANGDGPRDHPLLAHLNLPPLGQVGRAGPLLTRTLLFLGDGTTATNSAGRGGGGRGFRAYDKATGAVVWETLLPASASGTPMTYSWRGKQYIVVAVSEAKQPPRLVALSLP